MSSSRPCCAVPSLVSLPLLGYRQLDQGIYQATRKRLLSKANRWGQDGAGLGWGGQGSAAGLTSTKLNGWLHPTELLHFMLKLILC